PGSARAALVNLYGYVEEEYFVSGAADVCGPGGQTPADLRPLAAVVRHAVPFTTRAVLLRPKDKRKFSGNVHLIPFHNLDSTTYVEKNLLRNGDIWMGLEVNSGTRFGVEERPSGGVANLLSYNPRRYGQLSLPAGATSDWPDLQPGRLGNAYKTINFG